MTYLKTNIKATTSCDNVQPPSYKGKSVLFTESIHVDGEMKNFLQKKHSRSTKAQNVSYTLVATTTFEGIESQIFQVNFLRINESNVKEMVIGYLRDKTYSPKIRVQRITDPSHPCFHDDIYGNPSYGVFCKDTIYAGEVLGVMSGQLFFYSSWENICWIDLYRQYYSIDIKNNKPNIPARRSGPGKDSEETYLLDGAFYRNFVSYINDCHSDLQQYMTEPSYISPYTPNCVLAECSVHSIPVVFCIATKDINCGEELTIEYEMNYWDALTSLKQTELKNQLLMKLTETPVVPNKEIEEEIKRKQNKLEEYKRLASKYEASIKSSISILEQQKETAQRMEAMKDKTSEEYHRLEQLNNNMRNQLLHETIELDKIKEDQIYHRNQQIIQNQDPEARATCAFNPEHVMPRSSLEKHHNKCPDADWTIFQKCPYNDLHIIRKTDLNHHLQTCNDYQLYLLKKKQYDLEEENDEIEEETQKGELDKEEGEIDTEEKYTNLLNNSDSTINRELTNQKDDFKEKKKINKNSNNNNYLKKQLEIARYEIQSSYPLLDNFTGDYARTSIMNNLYILNEMIYPIVIDILWEEYKADLVSIIEKLDTGCNYSEDSAIFTTLALIETNRSLFEKRGFLLKQELKETIKKLRSLRALLPEFWSPLDPMPNPAYVFRDIKEVISKLNVIGIDMPHFRELICCRDSTRRV
ncbi:hypothetical protein WA158_002825 [Blastocystis sp. Blastoise]